LSSDFDPNATKRELAWRSRGHEVLEVDVSLGDLLAQVLVAPSQAAQRGLGGRRGVGEVIGGAQVGAGGDQHSRAQVP
jgi:hypothetical protein